LNLIKIKNYTANIALVLFSTYTTLLVVEISLAYLKYSQKSTFDTRTKLEVINTFNEDGIETYPLIYPTNLITENAFNNDILPFGTISMRHTINCNENGYWASFMSDRYGFNNNDINYDKPADVLLIGDSFAQGACVKQEKSIAYQLSKHGINTLSIATGSSGPLIELAMLKEYVSTVKPKYVLWLYFEHNDLSNLHREFKSNILLKYYNDDNYTQSLVNKQGIIDKHLKQYVNSARQKEQTESIKSPIESNKITFKTLFTLDTLRSLMRGMGKKQERSEKNVSLEDTVIQDKLLKLESIIQKAKKISHDNHAKFVFVYLPSWERYALKKGHEKRVYEDLDGRILEIIERNKTDLINFESVLSKNDDPIQYFPLRNRGHYNEDGYTLLSDVIEQYIQKNQGELK